MRVAVCGSTGALGGAIVRGLLAAPEQPEVVGLSRDPARASDGRIDYRAADYSNRASYEAALAGMDAVVLISAGGDPEVRIPNHRNVIEAAKSNGLSKIVYTSVIGDPDQGGFSPIVASNRQTETDVAASGLAFSIGRNGIYIEPDIEALPDYIAAGEIANCAGDGLCSYTTRAELADAYVRMVLDPAHEGHTYTLTGEAISQARLVELFNDHFGTSLRWRPMSYEDYLAERQAALDPFLGSVVAGIYQGIAEGYSRVDSTYEQAAGRQHVSWDDYFAAIAQG